MDIRAAAKALYDACPTVKPDWEQLGAVTQSVWIERVQPKPFTFDFTLPTEGIDDMSNITLKTIQARLGIAITGEFITDTLGVTPVEKEKRSLFWGETQYAEIVDKLMAHLQRAKSSTVVAAKPESKPKKEEAAAPAPAPAPATGGFNFGAAAAPTPAPAPAPATGGFNFGPAAALAPEAGGFKF